MPKPDLYNYFKPAAYTLNKEEDKLHLVIKGQKTGPPSRRISLHQTGLKISSVKIIRFDKHGPSEMEISRINHLPSVQQVRLHSRSIMYPGRYQIELVYKMVPEKLAGLGKSKPSRELLPSVDEAQAWQTAEFEFKQ